MIPQRLSTYDQSLKEQLGDSWYELLKDEVNKERFISIGDYIGQARKVKTIFPEKGEIFTAYKLCQPENIKVVIVGQDCYINKDEAHGLAFSIKGFGMTPSLKNIKESIEESVYKGFNLNWQNDLTRWAEQGVFLLNTILTVEKGKSLSHSHLGWQFFTKRTIEVLNEKYENIVYLLFGKVAQNFCSSSIDKSKNLVIQEEHPVAGVYAGRKEWIYNDCWNKTNNYLKEKGKTEINW